MSINRIGVILQNELKNSHKSVIFIFTVFTPIIMSLIVTLAFGSLFSNAPRIGIVDQGQSALTEKLSTADFASAKMYQTVDELKKGAEMGHFDMGVKIPAGFDQAVKNGTHTDLEFFIWGESTIKNRTLLAPFISTGIIEIAGQDVPVTIEPVSLGEPVKPWYQRLLPLLVLMSIIMSGALIPSGAIIMERQNKTLNALMTTPTSYSDILWAKGILGFITAFLTGMLTLTINNAFGPNPLLLTGMLALGAMTCAAFGTLLGTFVKDITGLFTVMKSLMLVIYAPAIIAIFPDIPGWIEKLFPTYYIISPITNVSEGTFSLMENGWEALVLAALCALAISFVGKQARKTQEQV